MFLPIPLLFKPPIPDTFKTLKVFRFSVYFINFIDVNPNIQGLHKYNIKFDFWCTFNSPPKTSQPIFIQPMPFHQTLLSFQTLLSHHQTFVSPRNIIFLKCLSLLDQVKIDYEVYCLVVSALI